jgi:hypothetical protein
MPSANQPRTEQIGGAADRTPPVDVGSRTGAAVLVEKGEIRREGAGDSEQNADLHTHGRVRGRRRRSRGCRRGSRDAACGGAVRRSNVALPLAIESSSKRMPPILGFDIGRAAGLSERCPREDGQEVADLLLAGERVGEGQVGLDRVVVAAAVALARDVVGGGELGDDAVRGAFGDPDRLADLAQADAGVVRDAEQHLGVVGEKRPAGRSVPMHRQ